MQRSNTKTQVEGSEETDFIGDGSSLQLNEYGENWIQELWKLEQSRSAKEFYSQLGELIRQTGKFSDWEREELAAQAAIPWTKGRGRPNEDKRNREIFMRYFSGAETEPSITNGGPRTRGEMIEEIMKDFNLKYEAAEKAYNKARKTSGQSPSIDRVAAHTAKRTKKTTLTTTTKNTSGKK